MVSRLLEGRGGEEGREGEVQVVPEEAEGEDGHGEGVAGAQGVAIEEAREDVVVIFCRDQDLDAWGRRERLTLAGYSAV